MNELGGDRFAARCAAGEGRRRVGDDSHREAEVRRHARGRRDAVIGHEKRENELLKVRRAKVVFEVRAGIRREHLRLDPPHP